MHVFFTRACVGHLFVGVVGGVNLMFSLSLLFSPFVVGAGVFFSSLNKENLACMGKLPEG